MVIISRGIIHDFGKKQPLAKIPLNNWYEKVKVANWKNFTEVKNTFGSADFIGNNRYVFNIGGNNFRIIALIHFNIRTIFIRAILTHSEYNFLSKENKLTLL